MQILNPYQGVFISAQSASSLIDLNSILNGCDAVDQEASQISKLSNNILETSTRLDVNTLSVDDATIVGSVEEYCTDIVSVQEGIMSMTSQIREAAINAYNDIQNQMNYDAQTQDQIAIQNSRRR